MRKHGVKFTQADFLESAYEKWGNAYDYSKVVYKHALQKIIIICPDHGEFLKTPAKHVNTGQGCPKCSKKIRLERVKTGTEQFIIRSKEKHGDKYDYSKVEYGISGKDPVTIICPYHGEFLQTPKDHLRGCECKVCGRLKSYVSRSKNLLDSKFEGLVQPEDHKLIPLGKGVVSKVDNEDFEKYGHMNWGITDSGYAQHHTLGMLHRLILKVEAPLEVDHKNRDRLDNRRSNLRPATSSQQGFNMKTRVGVSGLRGVSWDKDKSKWFVKVWANKKYYFIGYFECKIEGAKARDKKALELQGEFTYLNFPELKDEYEKQLGFRS